MKFEQQALYVILEYAIKETEKNCKDYEPFSREYLDELAENFAMYLEERNDLLELAGFMKHINRADLTADYLEVFDIIINTEEDEPLTLQQKLNELAVKLAKNNVLTN